MNSTRQLNVLD